VLVTEVDFQVVYYLPLALKAEVAWLNDARVDRADSDLMQLFALHGEERMRLRRPSAVNTEVMLAHGLEPWVAFGSHAELFKHLTLKQVHLRATRGQRGVGRHDVRGEGGEQVASIVRKDG
jgi:hypothetical protein